MIAHGSVEWLIRLDKDFTSTNRIYLDFLKNNNNSTMVMRSKD